MKRTLIKIVTLAFCVLLAFGFSSCTFFTDILDGIINNIVDSGGITFEEIKENLDNAYDYDITNVAYGEEDSEKLFETMLSEPFVERYHGTLENVLWYSEWHKSGKEHDIAVFECGSQYEAKELKDVISGADIESHLVSYYITQTNILIAATHRDWIDIAIGLKETFDIDTNIDTNTNTDTSTTICNHMWQTENKEPTCYEDGYVFEHCILCGELGYSETLPAEGHNMTFVETVEPTCLWGGYDTYACTRCEETERRHETEPSFAPDAHSVVEDGVEPTCLTSGFVHQICEWCWTTIDAESIPALGHTFERVGFDGVTGVNIVLPKCEENGYIVYTCTEEGCVGNETGDGPATYTITYEDMCMEGDFRAEQFRAFGHNFEIATDKSNIIEEVLPTCMMSGYVICECQNGCGEFRTFTDGYEPLLHSYQRDTQKDSWIYEVEIPPTCKDPGREWVVCTECGYSTKDDEAKNPKKYSQEIEPTAHIYKNDYCIMCGEPEPPYTRDGDTIYFGKYPQTKVSNDDLITTLNELSGTLPTSFNFADWTSFEYYINGEVSHFMWYIDIELDDDKYRGVYFTDYIENQAVNGYCKNEVYWFKYEPIAWNIRYESNGQATLLCDLIIDSRAYYPTPYPYEEDMTDSETVYENYYENSTIRAWLNNGFYNVAFDEGQKDMIIPDGLNDKISLLGRYDYEQGEFPEKKPTDYAKCLGVYIYDNDEGYGWWFLKTSDDMFPDAIDIVWGGSIFYNAAMAIDCGTVPTLIIQLD